LRHNCCPALANNGSLRGWHLGASTGRGANGKQSAPKRCLLPSAPVVLLLLNRESKLYLTAAANQQCKTGQHVSDNYNGVLAFLSLSCTGEPEIVDRIILALGLGSSRQGITRKRRRQPSLSPPGPISAVGDGPNFSPIQPLPEVFRSCGGTAQRVCQHVTVPHSMLNYNTSTATELNILPLYTGRKFLDRLEILQPFVDDWHPRATVDPELLPFKPTPFNITEHGPRYRRQSQCSPTSSQYVLFVLDTSSNTGREDFNRLTAVLGDLVLFFCSPIKVAVMTFDQEYFVEFCFDCFDSTCSGRQMTGDAITNIDYGYGRSGIRWRHTAGAARCVCDFMLTPSCGVPVGAECIDVVFITVGRSNDPNINVCNTIGCLHDRYGVTTHAIGVGNAFDPELECISNADPNTFNIFNFNSFDEFVQTFEDIINRLIYGGVSPSGNPYVCIGTRGLGTDGCHN
jgi:hypothetical protein